MNINIIKKPWVTEKATALAEKGQYVFLVQDGATKNEVKKAVQALYRVGVVSVNIVSRPPKPRRFRGQKGTASGYKKAVVTLKKGEKIDIT